VPDDGFTYHVPFEGRHTEKSVFPSLSKSVDTFWAERYNSAEER
jgi:hypothetical protein